MSSRINSGAREDCTAWIPPEVGRSVPATAALTAAETEVVRRNAHAEGYAAGRQEGLQAGRADAEQAARRIDAVLGTLAHPFAGLDASVEQELVQLAVQIARQLVRRELKADPAQIVGVVRDALQALPVAAREIRVHLHPEDAAIVRQYLPAQDRDRAWTIVEDPVLSRGGARVATATSQVDARLESRLGALIAEVLGSDREADQDEPAAEP